MCIIIANKQGILSKALLERAAKANPDGAGLGYLDNNNNLVIYKNLTSFSTIYKKYKQIKKQYGKDKNVLLHFRITSAGKTNYNNLHPFRVNNNLIFAHNGTIYQHTARKQKQSDTMLFNKLILQGLPDNFLENESIRTMLSDYIEHSKLVFLDAEDNFNIINEQLGFWEDGNWYSNTSHHEKASYYVDDAILDNCNGDCKHCNYVKGCLGFNTDEEARLYFLNGEDYYNEGYDYNNEDNKTLNNFNNIPRTKW